MKKSLVDVCVLTVGSRFDLLRKCLDSIDNQTFKDFNVFLFDNGSNVKEKLANIDLFNRYETRRSEQMVGFPKAANECIRMGKSPLVLFVTDDVELFPDTLDKLVKRMDDPSIGICGLKLLFPKGNNRGRPSEKVQHIGHGMTVKGDIIHPLVGWDSDHPKCCVSRDVISVTGAVFMTRRNLFNKIGGFYEGYGKGTFEDVEYCFSCRELGHRVFIDTDAMGYHYTGATVEKLQIGYPLQLNSMMFKSRWANRGMYWSEWDMW